MIILKRCRDINNIQVGKLMVVKWYQKEKALLINSARLFSVHPSGKVSNFLLEDYEGVLKFMNAENQKKKLTL